MKLLPLLLVATIYCFPSSAQDNIIVEKVEITETVDKKFTSYLPRLKDTENFQNPVVDKINQEILEYFMLDSFIPEEIENFSWYELDFISEIRSNILLIDYAGEYLGAYSTYIDEELYFNLETAEQLENKDITFQALFTQKGYLDFLQKHYLEGVKNSFKEAIECAETEPYCSYYDIYGFGITKGKFHFGLAFDCYPRVVQACSPGFDVSVPVDSVTPFLSDLGKKILLTDNYTNLTGIDRFLYNQKLQKEIPNNLFVFGKIDNKYPFSMAINTDSDSIYGYYFYNKNLVKLSLKGIKEGSSIELVETHNGEITGRISLLFNKKYSSEAFGIYRGEEDQYLTGRWESPDGSKSYPITFSEVKFNDRN